MDDKQSLLAIMEAVELLLGQCFQPQRTIYLAFGDDEEIGGDNGAARIVEPLHTRGIELEYVLDEGLAITEGVLPDVSKPLALIGVAEKGFVNFELSVEVESGHSSMPPRQTAIGILSAAVNRLEERQMPARIQGATRQMLEIVGLEMPLGNGLVMANLWLFGPLVERILSASPGANATVRTTTAATIIEGGLTENVLPTRARAIVNFRILPGDSIEGVISHVREVVNDRRVKVNRFGIFASEPSPVSDTDANGFQTVQRTIRELYPDVLVTPALAVSATDCRHYVRLTANIYRFSPMRVRTEDLERIHAINERISVQGLRRMREVLSSVDKELCPVAFHEIATLDFGLNGNSADGVA
jgi:carboxypeptidase PM20D1